MIFGVRAGGEADECIGYELSEASVSSSISECSEVIVEIVFSLPLRNRFGGGLAGLTVDGRLRDIDGVDISSGGRREDLTFRVMERSSETSIPDLLRKRS